MKRILITLFILSIASHYFNSLNAQNKDEKKKEKRIVLKIDKEENGKITKVDTTIILKDGEDPDKILEKYGIKDDKNVKHAKSFNFKIDDDDTTIMNKKQKMVWVTVNDDNDTVKMKKHRDEIVMITLGDDDDFQMDNGDVMIYKVKGGKEKRIVKEFNHDLNGDSGIFEKHIIMSDDDHMKHKKVYKYENKNMDSDDNVIFFSDGEHGEMDHMMMRDRNDDSDSTIIVTKKYKDGKEITDTKKILRNVKEENRVLIKVTDPEKADLDKLKLKENYKKLDAKNFNIMLLDKKMSLSFELAEKANTSIKLIDKDGKIAYNEDLKQFSGKYSKELDALKGEFYIQISQGSKYCIHKVAMDFN